jgi:CTP synthase
MRLGSYPCILKRKTIANRAYRDQFITERHRHRYEVNNYFRPKLEECGLVLSGVSPDDKLVEIIELDQAEHPFFIGVQFHPELKSRATKAHPIFREFVGAAVVYHEKKAAKALPMNGVSNGHVGRSRRKERV